MIVPESLFKGDVDLLKSAVGGIIQSFRELWGKRRLEGPEVAFEPTEGTGYDYFVKGLGSK